MTSEGDKIKQFTVYHVTPFLGISPVLVITGGTRVVCQDT